MTKVDFKAIDQKKPKFKPKMSNFIVSLGYEGLSLKDIDKQKSIAELKAKYAR
jgi:hypothetical protein